jgi:hypothetical protein
MQIDGGLRSYRVTLALPCSPSSSPPITKSAGSAAASAKKIEDRSDKMAYDLPVGTLGGGIVVRSLRSADFGELPTA